jgi:hypothetical protein
VPTQVWGAGGGSGAITAAVVPCSLQVGCGVSRPAESVGSTGNIFPSVYCVVYYVIIVWSLASASAASGVWLLARLARAACS